jgi:hypothetical protein
MRFSSAICGVIASALAGVVVAACGGDGGSSDEPTCLSKPVSTDCAPFYEPTFDNVWKNTLKTTCAASGCHSGSQPTGNMALDQEDQAYTNLMATSTTGEPRIKSGDVQCGKVIVRLNTKGKSYSMPPPPTSLSAGELCSIAQWIAKGATRQ